MNSRSSLAHVAGAAGDRLRMLAAVSVVLAAGCGATTDEPPVHVGGDACAPCHAAEAARWTASHHDLAMQPANDSTVLGDFSGGTFTYNGRESTFLRRDGAFVVRTEGPAGAVEEYAIAYTFGVEPLQQYLIAFPGGRLQALSLAWDTRPVERGGGRWFHLYPDDDVRAGDALHWTGNTYTWNHQCAACHSTNLEKNYDPASNTYTTSWSDIDVSCEACHGPGSAHVEWAEGDGPTRAPRANGLVVGFDGGEPGSWERMPEQRVARRTGSASRREIEICAQCHSRRQSTRDGYEPQDGYLDGHRPALLEPALYYDDGQILEEVYVYGSFLQSAMYDAGVVCSDCHDPHSVRVYDDGNGLCTRCHATTAYDTPRHHFHPVDSPGARCVECHMPARTYMLVDDRRDHSLRIPRPDLTEAIGTPNACSGCHADQPVAWAEHAIREWYGDDRERHYGEVLHAARLAAPGAHEGLADLIADATQPAIVRATALAAFGRSASPALRDVISRNLEDPSPLVRYGAARASESLAPDGRYAVLFPLLDDSVAMVRDEVGHLLAPVSSGMLREQHRAGWERAVAGYVRSQMANADRGESHLNLSLLALGRGDIAAADSSLQRALAIDSTLIAAYVNLADLRRAQGRDRVGEELLRTALAIDPDAAAARHAMGLLLVRAGRADEARRELAAASVLAPENARFAYVYGVALHSAGAADSATRILETASARHPYDLDMLRMLIALDQERGDTDAAIRHVRRVIEIAPADRGARDLLTALLAERRR